MTRINLVLPSIMTRGHLLAEYRELPRVFAYVEAAHLRGLKPDTLPGVPSRYVLGRGHVKFFYDKLRWLVRRQCHLVIEMKRRGYRPAYSDPYSLVCGIDDCWFNDWKPESSDVMTNLRRLMDREPDHYPYRAAMSTLMSLPDQSPFAS